MSTNVKFVFSSFHFPPCFTLSSGCVCYAYTLRCFLSCYQVIFGVWIVSVIGSWFNFLTLFYLCKFIHYFHCYQFLYVLCLKCPFYGILLTMSIFGDMQSLCHCSHCHLCMRNMKTRLMH